MLGLGLNLQRQRGSSLSISAAFDFNWKTDNVGTSNDNQATLPFIISASLDCVVTWGDADGSTTTLNSASSAGDLTHTYSDGAGTKRISISGTGINGLKFNDGGDKLKILGVSSVVDLDITEDSTFSGCANLTWTANTAPTITSTNLSSTFQGCSSFNGNISNWDVSSVINMNSMFNSATVFNQNISAWNLVSVTSMSNMFESATSFNQPLNSWNVGSVTNINSIFSLASAFNQPLNSWNVSNVLNMGLVFNNSTSFNQNISTWDVNQVTEFSNFMTGVTLSTANYDLILPAWNSQGAMSFSGTVNFGLSKYTGGGAVATAHSGLITKWGAITDGGIAPNNAFEFTWKTDNVGTSNDNQATLPITISADLDCVVTWGDADNSTTTLNASSSIGDLTHTYSGGAGTKNISILGTGINGFSFNNVADKLKILEVSNVGNLDITENSMFFGCTNLTWTATDVPTITTTNLSNTFKNCSNFNSNISNWDVSSVVNMSEMFSGASIYNQVLNSWNVGSVTDMADIFAGTSAFNQPLNSWNVGSVLNMNGMFSNATSFDQNISVWDINQVTNFTNFMIGATLSTTNYDLLLPAWDAQGAMSFSGTAHFGFSAYTAGGAVATAHASLTTKWGAITDGGAINGSFDFTWKTDNVGTSNDDQATLPITISAGLNLVVTWGDTDGSTTSLNSASSAGDLTHTYSGGAGTKSISISGSGINGFSFNNGGDKLKILQVSQVGDLDLTETSTFFGCTNLTWTATDAPTITTTNLENTFRDCTNFNGDISNWVVSNVTNINFILSSAAAFNQSLNGWDVSNVLTMDSAFNGNSIYNQPLNSWNVGSVTDMSDIFNGASLFNQDISSWNVSSVLNMNGMFNNTTNFNQNISSWDINQVTDFVNFMNGVTLSLTNYDLILPAWDGQGAMSFSGTVNFGASTYTAGGVVAAAHASLVTKWGGITDGGAISGGFDFTWKTDNSGASNSDQARLPFTISASLDCVVTWGDADGSTTTLNASSVTGDLTHTYSDGAGTKSISISGTGINGFRFAGSGDLLKILEVSNVGNLDITADATFLNCANLTWTATDAPTITTTNLTQTFRGCFNFNGNINNWDVSGVTTLANMFHVASSFNQPLNDWNVSSVTDMANLFRQASVFNQPLNSWNTSSVTDMQLTFFNTPSFNQDISAWDINQVSLFGNFMTALTLSTANYDLLLTAWDAQGAMSYSGTIPFGSSKYTGGGAVATARASLVTKWGAITDGGIA